MASIQIAIEYIQWLQKEREKINHAQLEDIEFFENGMKVDTPKEVIEEFACIGLNNTDFITSGYYRKTRKVHAKLEVGDSPDKETMEPLEEVEVFCEGPAPIGPGYTLLPTPIPGMEV